MLTGTNHLKVIDFGTAYFFKSDLMDSDLLDKINKIKQHEKEEDKDIIGEYQSKHKATFVGTAEFINFIHFILKTFKKMFFIINS